MCFKSRSVLCAGIALALLAHSARGASLPRVMLLIDEKSLGTIATAEIESMAIEALATNKLQVVDQDMVRSNLKKDEAMLKSVGDARGAAAIGLQYGAEIVIVGEAVSKPSARRIAESNLRTYEAAVTLRAIRTDNAKVLASASATESVVALDDVGGSSKALQAAGKPALDKLIPAMKSKWAAGGAEEGGDSITLSVGGVDQAWKLKALRENLRAMNDVILNLTQRSYTAGLVVFEVETVVSTQELSEKIVLNAPTGLKLQVLQVESGKIQLRTVAAE